MTAPKRIPFGGWIPALALGPPAPAQVWVRLTPAQPVLDPGAIIWFKAFTPDGQRVPGVFDLVDRGEDGHWHPVGDARCGQLAPEQEVGTCRYTAPKVGRLKQCHLQFTPAGTFGPPVRTEVLVWPDRREWEAEAWRRSLQTEPFPGVRAGAADSVRAPKDRGSAPPLGLAGADAAPSESASATRRPPPRPSRRPPQSPPRSAPCGGASPAGPSATSCRWRNSKACPRPRRASWPP